MSEPKPTIIVDIDGTIADCSARLHFITQFKNDKEATFKADWDAFYENMDKDDPIELTCALVRTLRSAGWGVILITGRSSLVREQTIEWLERNKIPWDLILMRKHGDHTDDFEIKRAWLRDMREGRIILPKNLSVPTIALEDRGRVVKMWREEGLIALQCAEGDF